MNLYIDFDRTLFNSSRFLDEMCLLLEKYNISKKVFTLYNSDFNPYAVLRNLKETVDQSIYNELDKVFLNCKKYLYRDAIPFLKYAKDCGYKVVIITKGDYEYQEKKIINSKIDNYYDELIITLKDKGELNLDYKNGLFIDDNPKEIQSILKNNPREIIRIKRKNNPYSKIKLSRNIKTVSSLNELIKK